VPLCGVLPAAENFTMIVRNEIQSEHWVSKQITLFIGISQHLDIRVWNDRSSDIMKSQEVTVVQPGEKPYYAVVEEIFTQQVDNEVVVKVLFGDSSERIRRVKREFVHVRRVVSVAHTIVSNDRHHDSAFVQVAMPRIKNWLKQNGGKYGCGTITEEFVRSDGAGSHFKNKYTM
jgi:hypothetical protein